MLRHAGAGLGTKVLNDELLDVAVLLVQFPNREQRGDALATRLADADQNAGGVRNAQLARTAQRLRQPGALSGACQCAPWRPSDGWPWIRASRP